MTPLVLVHGFMGGGDQWPHQDALGQDRELIRIDLPGFGANAHLAPLDRIGAFADWVLDDLTARGVSRFDLLGHSMGGMIVQDMVQRAPDRVRKLVLYATGCTGALPGRFETVETSIARARADGPEATARRIAATWFLKGEADPEFPACADIAAQSGLDAIVAGLDAMRAWSGEDRLGAITAETLIIWGEADRTYPWSQIETLWQSISNSRLAVLPSCAHAVHLERPGLFNTVLAEFLGESGPA